MGRFSVAYSSWEGGGGAWNALQVRYEGKGSQANNTYAYRSNLEIAIFWSIFFRFGGKLMETVEGGGLSVREGGGSV